MTCSRVPEFDRVVPARRGQALAIRMKSQARNPPSVPPQSADFFARARVPELYFASGDAATCRCEKLAVGAEGHVCDRCVMPFQEQDTLACRQLPNRDRF